MGWQDRKYSGPSGGGMSGNLWDTLNGSVLLGTLWNIRIRIHVLFIIFLVFNLVRAGTHGAANLRDNVVSSVLIFLVVLMHEFGHCFAARAVGGEAEDILMWPLGGLAYIRTPQRPWPSFVGTAGGPLVNVVLCAVSGVGLLAATHFQGALPLNPLLFFGYGSVSASAATTILAAYESTLAYYLYWFYATNLMLLAFNLLPIFPFDGGRIFQTILWPRLGFYASMNIACIVGMIGAAFLCAFGLRGDSLLFFLGLSGFVTCLQTRRNLPALSQAAYEDARDHFYAGGGAKPKTPKPKRARRDDDFSIKDLNPFERIARARRKKQFQRLFEDDEK